MSGFVTKNVFVRENNLKQISFGEIFWNTIFLRGNICKTLTQNLKYSPRKFCANFFYFPLSFVINEKKIVSRKQY